MQLHLWFLPFMYMYGIFNDAFQNIYTTIQKTYLAQQIFSQEKKVEMKHKYVQHVIEFRKYWN